MTHNRPNFFTSWLYQEGPCNLVIFFFSFFTGVRFDRNVGSCNVTGHTREPEVAAISSAQSRLNVDLQGVSRTFVSLFVSPVCPPPTFRIQLSSKGWRYRPPHPNKSKAPAGNAVCTIPYSTDNVTLLANMIFTEVEQNTLYNLFFCCCF